MVGEASKGGSLRVPLPWLQLVVQAHNSNTEMQVLP